MAKSELEAAIQEADLSIVSVFVPWSKSRNKGEVQRSLNWRVTLKRREHEILTTDYSVGIAHCPSYKPRITLDVETAIKRETETGKGRGNWGIYGEIRPDPCDVLHGLLSDAEAIDHATFEDWASDFGYDTDSRKAEAIYRACLEIGLKLRNGLGEETLRKLRAAAQDY